MSAPGASLSGPAPIAKDATSTCLAAAFRAHVDAGGALVLERQDTA